MSIIVNCAEKTISFDGRTYPCRIGRGGYIDGAQGREGDEKTPLGDYVIRIGFYRPDRLSAPIPAALNMIALKEDDGWCDAVDDPAYNRFVKTPYPGSHEKLWRADGAYDVVLVISHNDSPPQPGHGSAVFIHVAQPDDRETLGCVALTPDVMVKLIAFARPETPIQITALIIYQNSRFWPESCFKAGMKRNIILAGLFLVFIMSMSAVRYLEDYTTSYEGCAAKWLQSAKDAKTSPRLAAYLMEDLQDNRMSYNGFACPKLRPNHKAHIQNQLTASLKPSLRGLRN